MIRLRGPTVIALLLVHACAEEPEPVADEPRATYHRDVAPILNEHCASCHVEGGLAPFAVAQYESAATWAELIVATTQARTMPPFGADNSGACHTFRDARWLEDAELDTLAHWLEDGTPEGDPPAEPLVPPVPPRLEGPGIVEMQTPEYEPLPEADLGYVIDDHQCFLIDPGVDTNRFIVGFEVEPGNDAIVHHVLGFQVDPHTLLNATQMQALDDASPDRPGWDCVGAAGENVVPHSVPVAWAPGIGAVHFPADTGLPIAPDDVLVVQVHYNIANGSGFDRTTLRLQYADSVAAPAVLTLTDPFLESGFSASPASLPPGQASATYEWNLDIGRISDVSADRTVEVWGFGPHMHERGRKMHVRLQRNGQMECAADIDRYDFGWQAAYFLEQPIVASAADRIFVTCDWDTRADVSPVGPSFSTDGEMCLLGLYVVPR